MAKDDYYVIVGKILVYLYARMKRIEKKSHPNIWYHCQKDFPIVKEYFYDILNELNDHGYIHTHIKRAWGGSIIYVDVDDMRITQEGIDYLRGNSTIRTALDLIPMAAKVYELFQ